MEALIVLVSPLTLPAIFFRWPLRHNPFPWLCMGISLSGACLISYRAQPYPISVLMYFCQIPYLWSFYFIFFLRAHHDDSMCVSIGLCVASFVMLMQFFTIEETSGWVAVPYVIGMWAHMIWNLHLALRADKKGATENTACAAQEVWNVHSAAVQAASEIPIPTARTLTA
jgi:hypothetical protein